MGILFVPLFVESVGSWSDEAIHTVASIGCLQGQRLKIPQSELMTPLPVIGHLAMERERHIVDPPPASPSCQRGRIDLTDLVTSLFIYLFINVTNSMYVPHNSCCRYTYVCSYSVQINALPTVAECESNCLSQCY